MRPFDLLLVTFKNLFRQKGRTLLTVAQMMVGVFLISMMLSIGSGLKNLMLSQVTLFSNKRTMTIHKGSHGMLEKGILSLGFGNAVEEYRGDDDDGSQEDDYYFSNTELEEVREIEHVTDAVYRTVILSDYIRLDDINSKKLIITLNAMPDFLKERLRYSKVNNSQLSLTDGIVIPGGYADAWDMSEDELLGKYVWVRVTQTSDNELQDIFATQQKISRKANTKEFKLKIVGFVEKNVFSQTGHISPNMADIIGAYITDKNLFSYRESSNSMEVMLIVDEDSNVSSVDQELEDMGYNTTTYDESVGQIGVVFDIISIALTVFGLIAVGVSSIGVANTLLMAVNERMKEIGVMKAVGASSKTIKTLFITEAAWLGLFGGALGLGISYLISKGINLFLQEGITFRGDVLVDGFLSDYPALDISVYPVWMITVIMVLIITVAILAGISPAKKASKLDTIIALKKD
jgi:ABC-type antimicrobial peptide transport system permease subunit